MVRLHCVALRHRTGRFKGTRIRFNSDTQEHLPFTALLHQTAWCTSDVNRIGHRRHNMATLLFSALQQNSCHVFDVTQPPHQTYGLSRNSSICPPMHSSVFTHSQQLLLGNSSRPRVHIRFNIQTIFSVHNNFAIKLAFIKSSAEIPEANFFSPAQ